MSADRFFPHEPLKKLHNLLQHQVLCNHRKSLFPGFTRNLTKGWFQNKGLKFIRHEHKHFQQEYTIKNECKTFAATDFLKCNFDMMEVFKLSIVRNNEVAYGFPVGCGGALEQVLEYKLELFSECLDLDLNLGRSTLTQTLLLGEVLGRSLSQNYSFTTQKLSPVKKYMPKFEQAKLLFNGNDVCIQKVHRNITKLRKLCIRL